MITVPVHREVHVKLVELLDEPVEYGGTLKFNPITKTLDLANWKKGVQYDQVGIPSGLVQWHTHPRRCSPTRCTLGIPSGPDLAGFAQAAAKKEAMAHLVYSTDGVYGILIDPRFLVSIQNDTKFAKQFAMRSAANFNSITNDFMTHRGEYLHFRDRWLGTVNRSGFKIHIFPLTSPPVFKFDPANNYPGSLR